MNLYHFRYPISGDHSNQLLLVNNNYTHISYVHSRSGMNEQSVVSVYRVYSVGIDNILRYICEVADHSGRAVKGMNCLLPLKHWDRGFESHLRHGYLCAFILRLCYPVCR
jgi:hypothetical protein